MTGSDEVLAESALCTLAHVDLFHVVDAMEVVQQELEPLLLVAEVDVKRGQRRHALAQQVVNPGLARAAVARDISPLVGA